MILCKNVCNELKVYSNKYSLITVDSQVAVLKWRINKITDNHGNYMTFIYFNNPETMESWIEKIEYTGNNSQSLEPYNKIEFFYEY